MKTADDSIKVVDAGLLNLHSKDGDVVSKRSWDDSKSVVEIEGWVKILMRERGKVIPGSHRSGKNIWTNTGREYLAMLMSLQTAPTTPYRNDRVAYIGVGIGAQIEEAGVLALITPIAYISGQFLAALDVPPTFPLTPTRTTAKYHRIFAENEITLTSGSVVNLSEIGLFTNGRQSDYVVGSRDTTLAGASSQSPVAYKSFEPIGKTDSLQLEISWEIRF